MVCDDHLLAGPRVPPLLMAAGTADLFKTVLAQNSDHFVRGEPRGTALTQPSPQ